jgi:SpoVK/Ycf46/Vps4 family AAA+-type ATPase
MASTSRKRSREASLPLIPIITKNINSLEDLIEALEEVSYNPRKRAYTKSIRTLIISLENLQALIGMQDVKKTVVKQILYFMQGLHDGKLDMLHTIIQGPPGVGKTELAKALGHIYASMGILSRGTFTIARRSDLVGKYLGHTADKTQQLIDDCKGGVLLIDEAYSLGNSNDHIDSFSKECLDTLNQNLTENKANFMCIIAGYEQALEDCFFSANEGLRRRFSFKYTLTNYSSPELYDILKYKISSDSWFLEENHENIIKFLEKNKDCFPNQGGDIETLYFHSKLAHAQRMVSNPNKKILKIITLEDLNEGFKILTQSRDTKKENSVSISHLYL